MTAAALLILRGIPLLVWPLLLACAGFLYERHEVHVVNEELVALKGQDATDQLNALKVQLTRANNQLIAQQGVIDEQAPKIAAANAAASAAGSVVGRLRSQLAAISRRAASPVAQAASGIPANAKTVGVLADMLGRCEATSAAIAQFADSAYERGAGCQRAYEALSTTPTSPTDQSK